MLKRNYTYNIGDIEYSDGGIRLACKTTGITSTEDLVIPPNVSEVTDGTVVWSLIDISGGNDQVGTIIQYFGSNPPKGFLSCDGSIYNIIDYSRLANHIEVEFGRKNFFGGDGTTTFAVPDLRGEFLRGTGTNGATEISGSNVGYHQDATEVPRIYPYATTNGTGATGGYIDVTFSTNGSTNIMTNVDKHISTGTTRVYTDIVVKRDSYYDVNGDRARYIIRPTNTSVLYCIRW